MADLQPRQSSNPVRFAIFWHHDTASYKVSIPNYYGGDVVRLEALKEKLAEMELHDDLPDSHDIGYMAAWREITEWLESGLVDA